MSNVPQQIILAGSKVVIESDSNRCFPLAMWVSAHLGHSTKDVKKISAVRKAAKGQNPFSKDGNTYLLP